MPRLLHILLPFIILTSLLGVRCSFGQVNLVPNASFEQFSSCPDVLSQVYKSTGWNTYNYTPDWFHACATISAVQVPSNFAGYQVPASGDAYCGFITYNTVGVDREIIGIQLTSLFSVSQKYFISFKVSLGGAFGVSAIATNKTGVRFYTIEPNTVSINNWAHFYTDSIINDTTNWVRVFGSFIADSAYQYMLVGNFFNDSNTDTLHDPSTGAVAYYYIDDVCVSTDSALCYNYVGIRENNLENPLTIFPNPASKDKLTILLAKEDGRVIISIYDITGRLIQQKRKTNDGGNITIDVSDLTQGSYLLIISSENRKYSQTLLIIP